MSTQGRIAVLLAVMLLVIFALACGNFTESNGMLDAVTR